MRLRLQVTSNMRFQITLSPVSDPSTIVLTGAVPYLGLGPGAHSYDGCRMRCANNPDVNSYVAYWLSGKGERPFCLEELTEDELREEMIMTALRTREGIGIEEFKHRFGPKELKNCLPHRNVGSCPAV